MEVEAKSALTVILYALLCSLLISSIALLIFRAITNHCRVAAEPGEDAAGFQREL